MRLERRPARRSDLIEVFGKTAPVTVRAWVLTDGREVYALAGYYVAGGAAIVFSDIVKPLPKLTIWRNAKWLMSVLPKAALATTTGGGPFLERLGWRRVGPRGDEEVYEWRH